MFFRVAWKEEEENLKSQKIRVLFSGDSLRIIMPGNLWEIPVCDPLELIPYYDPDLFVQFILLCAAGDYHATEENFRPENAQ